MVPGAEEERPDAGEDGAWREPGTVREPPRQAIGRLPIARAPRAWSLVPRRNARTPVRKLSGSAAWQAETETSLCARSGSSGRDRGVRAGKSRRSRGGRARVAGRNGGGGG